jgi:MAF protein
MNKHTRCGGTSASADVWIIAADTIVVAPDDQSVLGKPTTREQAREMLRILRGKRHRVYSGLTLLDAKPARQCTLVASTGVHMRAYSDDELVQYVESGDPMDKAGAYAIQHEDFAPIKHLDNCYANVMGLPMCHLYNGLKAWYAQRPESAATLAKMRHPLTCCPYATTHGGCPWADSILTPENRTAPL